MSFPAVQQTHGLFFQYLHTYMYIHTHTQIWCMFVHTYVCIMNVYIFLNINWAVCVLLVMVISIGLTIWDWTINCCVPLSKDHFSLSQHFSVVDSFGVELRSCGLSMVLLGMSISVLVQLIFEQHVSESLWVQLLTLLGDIFTADSQPSDSYKPLALSPVMFSEPYMQEYFADVFIKTQLHSSAF